MLPFFGSPKGWLAIGLSGDSSEEGFAVECQKAKATFKTLGFKGNTPSVNVERCVRYFMRIFTAQFVFFWAVLGFLSVDPLWIKALWLLGLTPPLVFGAVVLAVIFDHRFREKLREYHGCEHKVIMLLSSGLDPTLENLKKMPKTAFGCGTSLVVLLGLMPTCLVVSSFVAWVKFRWVGQLGALSWGEATLSGVATIVFIGILLPFFAQLLLTTKEPRESILQEGVEVAVEARKVLKDAL